MRWLVDPRQAELNQEIAAWLLAAGLLGLAIFWNHPLRLNRVARRVALGALLACTLLATSANFFQSRNNGSWIHRWDLFHTIVGTKYFAELGYDRLYACAYVFGSAETPSAFARVKKIRNLRTLEYVRAEKVLRKNDCKRRFSPERASAFVADVHAFGRLGLQHRWHDAFKDKGYNGTPFYTLLAGAISELVPVRYDALLGIALIDLVLLAIAVFVVGRTRGLAIACLVLATLATCYPGRFMHMGGSLLRFDYVAALLIGFCALSAGRPSIAGFLLAYATLVRAFPALFVVGVLIAFAARIIEQRKLPPEVLRFCAGGLAGLALLGGATLAFGDGVHDWQAWWAEVRTHTRFSAAFRVGFKHMFMLDGNLTGDEGFVPFDEKAAHLRDRYGWYALSAVALLAPFVARARRLDPTTFGVIFGFVAFFLGLIATRYYYAVLALPLLADPRTIGERTYVVLAGFISLATAATYAIASWNDHAAFMNNTVVTATFTLLTLAVSLWSAWQLWHERRSRVENAETTPDVGAASSKAASR